MQYKTLILHITYVVKPNKYNYYLGFHIYSESIFVKISYFLWFYNKLKGETLNISPV